MFWLKYYTLFFENLSYKNIEPENGHILEYAKNVHKAEILYPNLYFSISCIWMCFSSIGLVTIYFNPLTFLFFFGQFWSYELVTDFVG